MITHTLTTLYICYYIIYSNALCRTERTKLNKKTNFWPKQRYTRFYERLKQPVKAAMTTILVMTSI